MSNFKFGKKSQAKMKGLHPDLIKILTLAIHYTEVDFGVIQGARTGKEQDDLWARGRTKPGPKVTWTRNSKHEIQKDGYAHAFDVGAYVAGVYMNGDTKAEQALYPIIAKAVKRAAKDLKLKIYWGPDIGIKSDLGHFQLTK